MKKMVAILLITALAVGCSDRGGPASSAYTADPSIVASAPQSQETPTVSAQPGEDGESQTTQNTPQKEPYPTPNAYLTQLVEQAAAAFLTEDMSEYERTKAAFDYMLENTAINEPVGQELWRLHSNAEQAIPFVEQRAISPLRFGIGMCEDYAAAMTMLLRGLGLQAEYVPGLTYSLEGNLVDHAWTLVCIDGVWYHLDSQLEDNISARRGMVRYRYFLKSDATLLSSHLWGERLIDSGLLSSAQNAELAAGYIAPECPQDYPTPEPYRLSNTQTPDLNELKAQVRQEMNSYQAEHGALPPMQLNTIPPVFGLQGYGPADEG